MNAYQSALRDFQDFADDVSRASYKTIEDALGRLASTLVDGTPFGDLIAELPAVDFDSWYAAQEATMGGMVASADLTWPNNRRERLALQVELMQRLGTGKLDVTLFAHTFLSASSRYDDHVSEFVAQVFRAFARDFLRFAHDDATFAARLKEEADLPRRTDMEELAIFISHSGGDVHVATALVALFEKSLKISARQIRCTSLDGYRLPIGADTNDVLRTEVFGARLFIGIITPSSLISTYVLFELGARWGARKPLYPILAAGATADLLKSPLRELNALSAGSADQLRQLVEEAAAALSVRVEPMASFSAAIEDVVSASNLAAV